MLVGTGSRGRNRLQPKVDAESEIVGGGYLTFTARCGDFLTRSDDEHRRTKNAKGAIMAIATIVATLPTVNAQEVPSDYQQV
jgi:hypothetical protein